MSFELFYELLFANWQLIIAFFLVSILYSSVGFGGGSSYLAILALTSIAFTQVRSIALVCNIIVVLGNIMGYQKEKLFDWRKIIPLTFCSIPLAFLGGYLKISQIFFFILLGITLLFAAVSMWASKKITTTRSSKTDLNIIQNLVYGGSIGFISGMVGIGGGIFLAPLLHLTNWSTSKKIAATASFFILVNSMAGLCGQYINPNFDINWQLTSVFSITVFIGGQIGNNISNHLFTANKLKRATALLVAFVGLRILWIYLF